RVGGAAAREADASIRPRESPTSLLGPQTRQGGAGRELRCTGGRYSLALKTFRRSRCQRLTLLSGATGRRWTSCPAGALQEHALDCDLFLCHILCSNGTATPQAPNNGTSDNGLDTTSTAVTQPPQQ
ncbi:hypothetical protein LEMLEM_LOCUS14586, partial [Lemmus lemmus]